MNSCQILAPTEPGTLPISGLAFFLSAKNSNGNSAKTMKIATDNNGLSPRGRTIKATKKSRRLQFILKPLWGLVLLLLIASCTENSKGQQTTEKSVASAQDSVKPKVSIKVNRRYDDKGNLVGLDSTYSSYYSNIGGDSTKMDSVMRNFDLYFKRDHPLFFNQRMNSLFFNDSLKYPDFFHKDFFQRHYELNDLYFRDMMKRMDSIKNKF
jgi:hypothetical protein